MTISMLTAQSMVEDNCNYKIIPLAQAQEDDIMEYVIATIRGTHMCVYNEGDLFAYIMSPID